MRTAAARSRASGGSAPACFIRPLPRKRGLLASDADVDGELERVARETEVPLSKVKAHYTTKAERESLREKIVRDKTLAFLQAGANIEEG